MPRKRAARLCGLLLALACASASAADAAPAGSDPESIRLASVHAAVADLDADRVIYRKLDDRSVPIASLTKLMTAMVVLDSDASMDQWLPVVERDEAAPNNAWTRMRVGSELPRRDLLRLALMASENHAAYLLARHYPGGVDAFVEAMNAKAAALGMGDTHFEGPSGLATGNRSSATDMLELVRAAHRYDRIRQYTRSRRFTARFRKPRYNLYYGNTNVLVYRNHWDVQLSKTGYLNEAGRCLAMVAQLDGRTIAMVLLNSFGTRTPIGDAGRIKRWLATGDSGGAAGAAMRYERRERARIEQVRSDDATAKAECDESVGC